MTAAFLKDVMKQQPTDLQSYAGGETVHRCYADSLLSLPSLRFTLLVERVALTGSPPTRVTTQNARLTIPT
jgi:hypothetical protein